MKRRPNILSSSDFYEHNLKPAHILAFQYLKQKFAPKTSVSLIAYLLYALILYQNIDVPFIYQDHVSSPTLEPCSKARK